MRLILNTTSGKVYSVHLPNHVDVDNLDRIIEAAKWELPPNEEILTYYLNSDGLTNDERKQMDIHGEVKFPPILLRVSVYNENK